MFSLNNISLIELPEAAKHIIEQAASNKLWAFYGEMGAGKTTLIKAICKQLGVMDDISSPTFSLVNEYKTKEDKRVYHFDFYRIKNLEEVYDMGYEEYFYSGAICLIEWSEKIAELLADEVVFNIKIEKSREGERKIYSFN